MSMASTATLVDDASSSSKGGKDKGIDFEKEMGRVKANKTRDEAPEYSDFEEDVTNLANPKDSKEWSPGFLQRHRSGRSGTTNTTSQRTSTSNNSKRTPQPPPLVPVPATPSLIKALDRIAVAQKDAFSSDPNRLSEDGMPAPGSPQEEYKGARWGDFWRDVQSKAR
jgi:hypothetical protein